MAISPMFIVLPCIYLMKNIDTTDPYNIQIIRMLFFGTHGLLLLLSALIYFLIQKNPNTTKITIKPAPPATGFLANLVPQPPPEPERTITAQEYDLEELWKFVKALLLPIGITTYLHFNMELINPLVIQSVMNFTRFAQHGLFSIYLLGNKDTVRPWAAESAFGDLGAAVAEATGNTDESSSSNSDDGDAKLRGPDDEPIKKKSKSSKKSKPKVQ